MRRLVLLALVALLAACGGEPPERDRPPGSGRLVVDDQLPRLPFYKEGSIGYLRVMRAEGGPSRLVRRPTRNGDPVLFDERLAPGRYRVVAYQRPCAGNCGYLDPPRDRCEVIVDVPAVRMVRRLMRLGERGGCAFQVPR